MSKHFDIESWSVDRAIRLVCAGQLVPKIGDAKLSVQIREWLAGQQPCPYDDKKVAERAEQFAIRLKRVFGEGENLPALEMHPLRWTWFALSESQALAHPRFTSSFEMWAIDHMKHGELPVIQRSLKSSGRKPIGMDGRKCTMQSGVPATTAPYHPFKKDIAGAEWRLVLHPLANSKSRTASGPHRNRSPGCEALLTTILDAMCRMKGPKVVRVEPGLDVDRAFYSPTLKQADVMKLAMKIGGRTLANAFADVTIQRSLRNVLKTERGARRKDL